MAEDRQLSDIDNLLVQHQQRLLVIVFVAPWLTTRDVLDIILNKVKREQPDIIISIIDIEDLPEFADRFLIKRIPTAICIDKGILVNKLEGFFSKKNILDSFQ